MGKKILASQTDIGYMRELCDAMERTGEWDSEDRNKNSSNRTRYKDSGVQTTKNHSGDTGAKEEFDIRKRRTEDRSHAPKVPRASTAIIKGLLNLSRKEELVE